MLYATSNDKVQGIGDLWNNVTIDLVLAIMIAYHIMLMYKNTLLSCRCESRRKGTRSRHFKTWNSYPLHFRPLLAKIYFYT